MITLIGLSGSTPRQSFNSALLRAAASMMPEGSELRIESIASIPLYNGDEETAHGVPEVVKSLKDAIAAAAGLLLVTRGELRTLIRDLKKVPRGMTGEASSPNWSDSSKFDHSTACLVESRGLALHSRSLSTEAVRKLCLALILRGLVGLMELLMSRFIER